MNKFEEWEMHMHMWYDPWWSYGELILTIALGVVIGILIFG